MYDYQIIISEFSFLLKFLESQPLAVHEAKSSCTKTRLDAKMCPQNPDLLAYISASDVWVANTATGHEKRLTFAHKGDDLHSVSNILGIFDNAVRSCTAFTVHQMASRPLAQFDLILAWANWKLLWATWNNNEIYKHPILWATWSWLAVSSSAFSYWLIVA